MRAFFERSSAARVGSYSRTDLLHHSKIFLSLFSTYDINIQKHITFILWLGSIGGSHGKTESSTYQQTTVFRSILRLFLSIVLQDTLKFSFEHVLPIHRDKNTICIV